MVLYIFLKLSGCWMNISSASDKASGKSFSNAAGEQEESLRISGRMNRGESFSGSIGRPRRQRVKKSQTFHTRLAERSNDFKGSF